MLVSQIISSALIMFTAFSTVISSSAVAASKRKPQAAKKSALCESGLSGPNINSVGFRIFNQVARDSQPRENIFLSPFSLTEAIAMVLGGAKGNTEKELREFLGIGPKIKLADYARMWAGLRSMLIGQDPQVKFSVANSAWANGDLGIEFLPAYLSHLAESHGAVAKVLPFSQDSTARTINDWVSRNTDGMIPGIVSPPLPTEGVFYVINAIFFDGKWTTPFEIENTKDADFTRGDGSTKRVKMMSRGNKAEELSYFQSNTNGIEAAALSFGEKRQYRAVFILPPSGQRSRRDIARFLESGQLPPSRMSADQLAQALTAEKFDEIRKGLHSADFTLQVPRFRLEYSNEDVKTVVQALGLCAPFDKEVADFSKMVSDPSGNRTVISRIVHKAVGEFTEAGAKAAATTLVGGLRTTSWAPSEPIIFRADRPFMVVIEHIATGTVVFAGKVSDPEEPRG